MNALKSSEGIPARTELHHIEVVRSVLSYLDVVGVYFAQCHDDYLSFFTIIIIAQNPELVKPFFEKNKKAGAPLFSAPALTSLISSNLIFPILFRWNL
jgi:hypothetical protein